MYSFSDQPELFEKLSQRSSALLAELFAKLTIHGSERRIPAQVKLFSGPKSRQKIYRLKEGVLTCRSQGRPVFAYEVGDLAGVFMWEHPELISVSTDFAVIADEYSMKEFEDAIWANVAAARLWNEFLSCQFNMLIIMLGTLSQRESEFAPEIRSFAAGEEIIRQGEHTKDVFTLIEGSLEVTVDGVKVGEVLQDEIFGALAAAADTFRTATVTARERSVVVVVPKEQFLCMVQTRPTTTLKLIQDMARTIVSLNKKVVSLS